MSTKPLTPTQPAPIPPPVRKGWQGSTRRTLDNSAMLGAKWWEAGDELYCIYQRSFDTKFGEAHEFMLVKPQVLLVSVDEFGICRKRGEEGTDRDVTRFALPPLAGFEMAVQDCMTAGFPGFKFGDAVIIKCVEVQPPVDENRSPMPMFEISVDKR